MKKKIFIIFGIFVLVLLIAGIVAITSGLSDGANVVLDGINLSGVADGSYVGTYEHGRWTNTLTVRVENRRIIRINIVTDVFMAGITNCSDEILKRVIANQNTQIDIVAGANVTSKAYLKAIEDALKK